MARDTDAEQEDRNLGHEYVGIWSVKRTIKKHTVGVISLGVDRNPANQEVMVGIVDGATLMSAAIGVTLAGARELRADLDAAIALLEAQRAPADQLAQEVTGR